MSKYGSSLRQAQVNTPKTPHPVWNGIGCLLMIIVPILSIAIAVMTVQVGVDLKWPIPRELLGYVVFPDIFFSTPQLAAVFLPIANTKYLIAYIAFSLLYIIVLGGLVSLLYAILHNIAGPARYSPIDAPPPNIKAKRYKR